MPEITVLHVGLLVAASLIGIVVGWVFRGSRSQHEKAAVSAGWQEQLDAQRKEHERLVNQNKNLMDQVSQFQASNRDAKNRAKELSTVVQEAFARRDELQREIKDIRSNLEVAVTQRDRLRTDLESRGNDEGVLKEKDDKIFQLSRELENWQDRLPPLIERYRARDEEALKLESELAEAQERIRLLEQEQDEEHAETRIEPVNDPDTLTDGRDASNDPIDDALDDTTEGRDASNDPIDDTPDDAVDNVEEELVESAEEALDGSKDNLKKIKGVGPAIEKTLNELGIFRFEQIADMSEYDIDRVAQRLKGFHSRIYREDWMGQARELLERERSA